MFLQAVIGCQLPELGQGPEDLLRGDAVGDPHVAGAAEAVAGDQDQVIGLGFFAKGLGVGLGGPGEEVEGPVRLGAGVAHLPQRVQEDVPILFINRDIGGLAGAPGGHQLEEGGGAHIAQGAACSGDGGVDQVEVLHRPGNQHVADALTGQGEGLTIGITNQGVGIIGGDPGQGFVGVADLPVGLVGNQIDGVAVLSGLILQHPAQLLHGFPGVDHPGGIVGGVDDDRLGIGAQGLLKGGEIDLEILDIGGDGNELAAGALHKDLVLGEVGGEGDELVPLTAHGRQAAAQGGRRPHGEVETVPVIGCAKTAV